MSGPKMDKVADEWRKRQNEELHDLLLSVGKRLKGDEMERYVERRGQNGNTYGVLVGKPKGKTTLGKKKTRLRREYNIKTDIKKIGREGTDTIYLALDRRNGELF